MALEPLNDTVFIEIVQHEPDSDLADELKELTSEFESNLELGRESRRLEAVIASKKPQTQQGYVTATGPACKILEEDDLVIFPLHSGSMVTIFNEETQVAQRVFVISEINCLARLREG